MDINLRMLLIRNHKNVTFINGYSNEFGVSQFMIENDILKYTKLKCGDLINIKYIDTINISGNAIKQIIKINSIVSCVNFDSFKGINSNIIDTKYKDYLEARNGGIQIQILKYKQEIIKKIREVLDNLDFFDATGLLLNVEHYKNGSSIIDAEISDRDIMEPRFLRVTLENQLKQLIGIILKSSYSIDKVYRNMGEDSTHINEFLMLEFVSLNLSLEKIIEFVKYIDEFSRELAQKYNLTNDSVNLDILDYKDVIKYNFDFEKIKSEFKNLLIINYPCDSLYIKKDLVTNNQTEIRWYMNGRWISHFYEDENSNEVIRKAIEEQNVVNNKEHVNPLNYFEWGLPFTTSFGLSIDRWLQMLLQKENINSIANPIELDYVKKNVRRK